MAAKKSLDELVDEAIFDLNLQKNWINLEKTRFFKEKVTSFLDTEFSGSPESRAQLDAINGLIVEQISLMDRTIQNIDAVIKILEQRPTRLEKFAEALPFLKAVNIFIRKMLVRS